jgi:hypothetical protein
VIVWLPAASEAVDIDAVPEVKLTVPKVVAESRKVTVPLAVPVNRGVTVAVNVTVWPNIDGFKELVTALELVASFTVCVMADDALLMKLLSPPYETVIVWLPAESVAAEIEAVPEVRLAVPNVVAESRKVTVPVGVPVNCGVTVAVKVTVWPKIDGFNELVTALELVALFTVCVIAAEVLLLKLLSPP